MSPLRVVIADDHVTIRHFLRERLKEAGCEVIGEAATGAEAIALAGALSPDLILMDHHMPVMDGAEATREIKKRDAAVEIIALSSMPERLVKTRMLAAGASSFYDKLELSDLVGALEARGAAATLPGAVIQVFSEWTGPAAITRRAKDELPLIIHANSSFFEFTGYERRDVVGKSADFWLSFGVALDDWTAIGGRLRAGERVEHEIIARRKNGSRVYLRMTMLPFVSEDTLDVITIIEPLPAQPRGG